MFTDKYWTKMHNELKSYTICHYFVNPSFDFREIFLSDVSEACIKKLAFSGGYVMFAICILIVFCIWGDGSVHTMLQCLNLTTKTSEFFVILVKFKGSY